MRYFYTDPLEAAYMAKHYGMRFNRPTNMNDSGFYTEDFSDWYGCGLTEVMYGGGFGKFYIHPDSLAILEPQVGDLFVGHNGLFRVDETHYPKEGGGWEPGPCWKLVDGYHRYFPDAFGDERKIIQRQGKAFFWPEVGE